jgi:hypothetical protein
MKSKSFAFAALRIISIWILVEYVIVNIFTNLLYVFQLSAYEGHSFSFLGYAIIKPLSLAIICSIISWFLWFKADVLSNILITTETNENNIESFSSEKFLSVALIILGFYFIFDSAPDLVQNIVSAVSFNSLTTDFNKKTYLINIIQPALTLLIGIFCILKADRLKSLVKRWL